MIPSVKAFWSKRHDARHLGAPPLALRDVLQHCVVQGRWTWRGHLLVERPGKWARPGECLKNWKHLGKSWGKVETYGDIFYKWRFPAGKINYKVLNDDVKQHFNGKLSINPSQVEPSTLSLTPFINYNKLVVIADFPREKPSISFGDFKLCLDPPFVPIFLRVFRGFFE